jgi:hypothetical protein
MQVPILYDNRPGVPDEKRWLRDTTPMILYLEATLPPPPPSRRGAGAGAVTATAKSTPPHVVPSDDAMNFMTFLLGTFLSNLLIIVLYSTVQYNIVIVATAGLFSLHVLSNTRLCAMRAMRALCAEDFADEAMWRPAMYFRWVSNRIESN